MIPYGQYIYVSNCCHIPWFALEFEMSAHSTTDDGLPPTDVDIQVIDARLD
jgi:hypothetical protein